MDTPYAISSDSRASLDRQTMPPHHAIITPEPDSNLLPPRSFKFGTASSTTTTPNVDPLQNHTTHNGPSGSSGHRRRGSGSPPSPVIGRAGGRPNLPRGAMPPAHFRVQSQSAIVVNPDPSTPGPSGSNGLRSGAGVPNVPGNVSLPMRVPQTRYTSDDETPDSPPPKKKPWFLGLRNKGQNDDSPPADEETGPSTGTSGANAPGRAFVVVRKNQGQGQSPSHGKGLSTAGNSGGDDSGPKKGTFVVLRGRDAHSDSGPS